MLNIDFKQLLNTHSSGYVIKTMDPTFNIETLVMGNRSVIPTKEPMTEDCLFDIASLTKVFTSIVTYQSVESGLINLEDSITRFAPEFKNLQNVDILDLLSHRVECWTSAYLGDVKGRSHFEQELFTAYVKEQKQAYKDVHYMILSYVLEKIYGASFEDIILTNIARPLDLNSITFNPCKDEPIVSSNYERVNGIVRDDVHPGVVHDQKAKVAQELGFGLGHAGIFSDTQDLMSVLISLIDNREQLLKKETVNQMFRRDGMRDFYPSGMRHPEALTPKTPGNASDQTAIFNGYTGPVFTVDFERNIIILLMANICHNSKLSRQERFGISKDMINKLYNGVLDKSRRRHLVICQDRN